MHEKGTPLPCLLAVVGRTAAEFIATAEMAEQSGLTPTGDEFAALAEKEIGSVEALNR